MGITGINAKSIPHVQHPPQNDALQCLEYQNYTGIEDGVKAIFLIFKE
jgi:hypothetical protein